MEELIEKLENLKNELNDTAEVVRVKDLNLKMAKDNSKMNVKIKNVQHKWETLGGLIGGACGLDPIPEFEAFNEMLLKICPSISFLQHKKQKAKQKECICR